MEFVEIDTPHGKKKILIKQFPAMEGWELESRFRDFCLSDDKEMRKAYTMEVLKYATVEIETGNEIHFKTTDVINNHLCSWQNVKIVFEKVLKSNGIDPDTFAETSTMKYWEKVGDTIGVSLLASIAKLMDPAIRTQLDVKE